MEVISTKMVRQTYGQAKFNDPESGQFQRNLDFNYTFRIDLAPNRIPVGAKSTGELCNYNPTLA